MQIDMREKLPFENEEFDLVFANLAIHYFSDSDTKKLITEIRRILKMKDLENYLDIFYVVKIDERETIRFNHKKNYLIFIVKK